jgi:lysophospholipase L1-like esterase
LAIIPRIVLKAAGLALIAGLCLEIMARLDDWYAYGANPLIGYDPESMLLDRDEGGIRGKANGRYEKWVLNSLGFRGPEVAVPKPAGTVRIVTLGASETFGLYESAGMEWPNQLRKDLAAAYPGRNIEIVNTAIVGLTIPSLAGYYHRRIEALQPDLVVLYPHFVEFVAGRRPGEAPKPRGAKSPAKPSAPKASFPGPSRFLPKMKLAVKSKAPAFAVAWLKEQLLAKSLAGVDTAVMRHDLDTARLAAFDSLLTAFALELKGKGVGLMVSEYACAFAKGSYDQTLEGLDNLWKRYPWMSRDLLLRGLDVYNAHIRAIAAATGALDIPQTSMLDSAGAYWVSDGLHFTDRGAAAMMHNVGAALRPWLDHRNASAP